MLAGDCGDMVEEELEEEELGVVFILAPARSPWYSLESAIALFPASDLAVIIAQLRVMFE